MCPKSYVPLGTYRKKETKGLIIEIQGDCWVTRSYKVDGHNDALKVIICSQCHVTPMGSYMVGSGQSRVVGTDRTHGMTHSIGCSSL